MAWLVRDGEVLAAAEVARAWRARSKGLLGRDTVEGALVLLPAKQIHTLGMRIPIDVAFCGRDGRVLRTACVRPWRMTRLVVRSHFVVEAAAGAFERWRLHPGDVVELHE